jgi:uncharacterized protein YjiS (DUF1127 family)
MTALVANFNRLGLDGLIAWYKNRQARIQQDRDFKSTVRELSKLTDKELRDIGITRGDIYSIAMETHYDNHCNLGAR